MKKIGMALLIGMLSLAGFAQDTEVIYSFTTNNHKTVQILYDDVDRIFTFRLLSCFKKIKVEVTDDLKDDNVVFTVRGYHRGGGIENAAMDYNDVVFSHDGYAYDLYYVWAVNEEDENIENDPIFGVKVYKDGKEPVDMKGRKIITGEPYGWSFYDILPETVIDDQ